MKRKFVSLNFKLAIVVVIAMGVTLGVYIFSTWFESFVADRQYLSEEAEKTNVDRAYDELEDFVNSGSVKATSTARIQRWLKNHEYTYLYIYDDLQVVFEAGWWVGEGSNPTPDEIASSQGASDGSMTQKLPESGDEGEPLTNEDRISYDTFEADVHNRIITFADGDYYVYIDVYREQHWYDIMFFAKLFLCFMTFICIVLVYNGHVTGRLIRLSDDAKRISEGDLKGNITAGSNDEIGSLAVSVDHMRDSILEKLGNEKEAWDANTQLITAMSHDIRTPLTSLIGYLDIIDGGKYGSEEELKKHIASCRDKAFQLKDLSDKLFQYFLVFGGHDGDKQLEKYDAGILLQQLLSEHTAELINYGFEIDFEYTIPEVSMLADISGVRRLFDNVFSNIMKYGDRTYHVRISAGMENGQIVVRLLNGVLSRSRKVESNKIGLKNCEKICIDMGGNFNYKEAEQVFSVRMAFPVHGEIKTGEETAEGNPESAESAGNNNETPEIG